MDGKVVLITGAAGIIGSETARVLAGQGATLALADVSEESLERLAASLDSATSMPVSIYPGDLSSEAGARELSERVVRDHGRIDVFHHCVVYGTNTTSLYAPLEEYSLEQWRECMGLNIDAMFLCAQSVGRVMIESGRGGNIILMSSVYGHVGPDDSIYEGSLYDGVKINTPGHYPIAKAGATAFARYIATTWAKHGIRANSVTPGGVASGQNEQFTEVYSKRVPLGRMADASEIAWAVAFLASDASSYVTGTNLIVDGGFTAW